MADSLAAQVRDQYGNPVPQAAVVWTVRSGGGTVSPATSTTSAQGIARALWTLGTRVDSVQVADAAAGVALRTEFTATAAVPMGAALVVRYGGGQTGTVGAALPEPVKVALLLATGVPVVGATVTWTPTAGTASPQTSVTDGNGEASTTWTLGTTAGAQGLTASSPGAAPVTVSATAQPGPAAQVLRISGDGQSGPVGSTLAHPLVVRVADQHGNSVAGAPVAWAVTSGGGSVSPVTGTTDAEGRFSTAWTLGGTRGTQTVRASSGTLPPVSFTATANAINDTPPQLSVTAPVLNSVARPGLRVDADCTDDDPAGCASVRVYLVSPDGRAQLASGTTGDHTTVSLAGFDGKEVTVEVVGTDSRNQTVTVSRRVYVESSARWAEEASAGALLLDLDAQRVLFFDVDGSARIATRGGGGETILRGADPAAFTAADSPARGWLHSQGAVFTTGDSDAAEANFDWHNGTLVSLGGSPTSLRAAGDWAIWTGKLGYTAIYRRDLASGTTAQLAGDAANIDQAVAANGDVAFWNSSYDIVRYRNGVLTPLTSDDDAVTWNVFPETDGTNVVFRSSTPCCTNQVYAIEMIAADGSRVSLTPASSREVYPRTDYAANGGWVAYTLPGAGGIVQVWTRSPDGTLRQATQLGTASSIRALGPNGELAFASNGRLYVALPPYTSAAVDVGAAGNPVRLEWRGSDLFAFLGRSAFRVSY
ncbi:MAG TPA: Ig-like domain-containing protein [Longimicrobium sp.]|nr:Ig-like domain-containing protein [Longimicrobium sp.]